MKVWGTFILLLLPWLAMAQEQYYGSAISAIRLAEPADPNDARQIPLKIGEVITPANLRAAIQALYDTGHYRYVEVDASPADAGTALTFHVQFHYFFSTFLLEPRKLLDRSLSSYFRIPLGERFSTAQVDRIVDETRQLLEDQGYFSTTITPEYIFENPTRLVHVTLNVTAMARARIGMIQLQGGEQTFSHEELLSEFDVKSGEDVLADRLSEGAGKVRNKFSKLGFLNTKVDVRRVYNSPTNTVDIEINVEPGQFTLVQTRGYDIDDKQIRSLVPVFEEGAVDPDLIEEGRIKIVEYVQQRGFFDAAVSDEVIEAPLDNAVQINYIIDPGPQHSVGSIHIKGNKFLSDEDLYKRLSIRGVGFFRKRGVFSPELLSTSLRQIENFYRDAGFEGTVVTAKQEQKDNTVDVVIEIQEGRRRPIDYIVFIGNFAIPEQELRKAINLTEGDIYTPPAVEEAHNELVSLYYSRGYSEVSIEHPVEPVVNNGGMRVTFQITEGEQHNIGDILVAGNTITAEKIVHRNSKLYRNSPYNPEAILEAQQRLYATGLFTRVEIVPLDRGNQAVRDLLIQLEDAKPIVLTYGIGVATGAPNTDASIQGAALGTQNTFAGPRGTVEISHNNLFGLARSISLRVRGSQQDRFFQATYGEPKLFNHDIEGFASLWVQKTQGKVFDTNRVDFSLQALRRLSAVTSLLFTANYQTVNLLDIRLVPATRRIPDQTGIIQVAQLGGSLVQDRRDDPINPQTGSLATSNLQVASKVLGSEVDFVSFFNQTSNYIPFHGGVLATSVRVGWGQPYSGDRELPVFERYFAGGSTTLRGFSQDEVGPPGGGQLMTIGNVELRKPLTFVPISGFIGALFYDTGTVFERPADFALGKFTHTAGAGLRYLTPLGIIRFDMGINLDPKIRLRTNGTLQPDERVKFFLTLGNAF